MAKTFLLNTSLLGGVAALSLAFAVPAFAQDAQVDIDPEVQTTEEMSDTLEKAADDIDAVADDLSDDTSEMTDEFDAEMDETLESKDDAEMWDADVETKSNTTETVTCPEGTEVQDDGSCMATGDWTPEG